MRRLLPFLPLLAACATPAAEPQEIPATREDVAAALYEQLDLVLQRREALADDDSPEAERERAELARLAAEITVRIVRIDPSRGPEPAR